MKRKRPSKHIRRVKVGKGRKRTKRVLVNPHIKKRNRGARRIHPDRKSRDVKDFIEDFQRRQFGRTTDEAIKEEICVTCGKPVLGFRDALSRKEFELSGMCQKCQDEVFGTNRGAKNYGISLLDIPDPSVQAEARKQRQEQIKIKYQEIRDAAEKRREELKEKRGQTIQEFQEEVEQEKEEKEQREEEKIILGVQRTQAKQQRFQQRKMAQAFKQRQKQAEEERKQLLGIRKEVQKGLKQQFEQKKRTLEKLRQRKLEEQKRLMRKMSKIATIPKLKAFSPEEGEAFKSVFGEVK